MTAQVVSDCDAISDTATHNYILKKFNGSLQVQAQQAIRGGTDVNCGALYGEQNAAAVRNGLLREEELDVALERLYSKSYQLGIPDITSSYGGPGTPSANPYTKMGPEVVDTPMHRQLALEGALQGQVLLKNQGDHLPLKKSSIKKLALIGPHANGSIIFLGGPNYHGNNRLINTNTPLLRAQAKLPGASVTYAHGCNVSGTSKSEFATATAAAAAADTVVLFLGLDDRIENEGHDRSSLELPGQQEALALAVAEAATAPVTIVLTNGGPISLKALKDSPKVGAILEGFMPGQYAAEATMQMLLGEVSPSGLLPVTVYDADFIQRRPITDLDLRGSGGVTYRYFDGVPQWPFGFGLSFGSFTFTAGGVQTLHTTVAAAESKPLCFSVTVTNEASATMESDVVVLGFIGSSLPDSPRNAKLCDFQREAAVKPGESRTVKLCVDSLGRALALVDQTGNQRVVPGEYTVTMGVEGSVGGAGAGKVVGKVVVAA